MTQMNEVKSKAANNDHRHFLPDTLFESICSNECFVLTRSVVFLTPEQVVYIFNWTHQQNSCDSGTLKSDLKMKRNSDKYFLVYQENAKSDHKMYFLCTLKLFI